MADQDQVRQGSQMDLPSGSSQVPRAEFDQAKEAPQTDPPQGSIQGGGGNGSDDLIGEPALGLKIDASSVKKFLQQNIRDAVQDVLQVFMEEEAATLCGAGQYERTEGRRDHRNGHRERKLVTRVGEVVLKVPRLRELAFTTAIVERYQRRECSIDEALLQMYFAGVSTRRVGDITEVLWGGKVSADQMSTLNGKVVERLEKWRKRPIQGKWSYIYVDGFVLSRRWDDEVHPVSVLVAVGVNEDGRREVLGVMEGCREDYESWRDFLLYLKDRGLVGLELVVGDRAGGLLAALKDVYPQARYQRCIVHFYRNVLSKIPKKYMRDVAAVLKAIHAQENAPEARAKAQRFIEKFQTKFPEATKVVADGIEETLSFYRFPSSHWRYLRTTNMVERLIREVRRRTDVVGAFPDGKSALVLVCARLQWVTERSWTKKRYVLMEAFDPNKSILDAVLVNPNPME